MFVIVRLVSFMDDAFGINIPFVFFWSYPKWCPVKFLYRDVSPSVPVITFAESLIICFLFFWAFI